MNVIRMVVMALAFVLATAGAQAAGAKAESAKTDSAELTALGFKTLVATTPAQKEWVRTLKPGKVRAMQRNGRKFYIFAEPAQERIFVGGPTEYAAWVERHPESGSDAAAAARQGAAQRAATDNKMQAANKQDLSDPFLGAPTWYDLGW